MGCATGRLWRLNGWGWFDKAAPFRNNCLQVDTPAAPRIGPTLNPQCENLMQIIKTFLAASLVLALAACGGGGDSGVTALAVDTLQATRSSTTTDFTVPANTTAQANANVVDLYSVDNTITFSVTHSGSTVTSVYIDLNGDEYLCNSADARSEACDTSAITVNTTNKTIQVHNMSIHGYTATTAPASTVDTPRSAVFNANLRWN
jgi:hypothetical protein